MNLDLNLKIFSIRRKISISKQWLQFGIMVIAVLGSVIISYWGSDLIMMLVPVILGCIAGFLIFIKQIRIGFILILLAGMFVPFTGPGGVNAAVLMVIVLIGMWFLEMLIVKRHFHVIRSRTLLPVVMMLVISIIAFGMGQLPWFLFANQAPLDAQLGGFAIFAFSMGLMLTTAHLIEDVKWLKFIVWTFIGLGAVYIVGRAFELPVDRFYQNGFVAGSMFWTWLVAHIFSQIVFNKKLKTSRKWALLFLLLFTFYVTIVQGYDWKSGWVPPLVVIGVLLGLRYPRLVILAIPVAVILAGYAAIQLIASDEYSWGTRVDAWIIVLEISKVSPIFGLGFANYYWYTPLFPIRGFSVSFNSHSQFVDLIAQVGILGLLCFLWIFYEAGRLSWKLMKQLPDGFARAYSYGVFAGIAGTLAAAFLVDWVLPFVYNIGLPGFRASLLPWIFLGGLVSLENIYLGTKSSLQRGHNE